jgi:hypothetical protein
MNARLSTLTALAVATLLTAGLTASAQEKKVDPTGTWTWTAGRGDNTMTQTLKLKLEGDKLTGHMVGRNNRETPIEEAKLKGDEISFQITRERGGNTMVSKYKGKISGDTIKGTIEFKTGDQERTRDWEAKKETKKD